MNKLFIICIMILFHHYTIAQNKITGKITDQDSTALIGATIFIPDMSKGTVSNSNGYYELSNLTNGKIILQFSYIGYNSQIVTVDIEGGNLELDITLKQTAIQAEEIVISGGYNATQHENAVKIDLLKLNPSKIRSTPNFTEVLTKVPGIDMISKGSGVSKPVIRGLSMNDILVLNNGVRFENYQYSSHHPLGIDEFGIEDVEIIKGPASLLYGSDAIGGVINFIKEKPAPIGCIVGDYNLQLFSNTLGMTNNFGIKGASKKFFGGLRIGQKTNSDFLQGGGVFVPNSRFNEYSIKANTGYTDKFGTFKLFYDFNNQKLGMVEDEAIQAITIRGRENRIWFQELSTHLISSQNKLQLGKSKLDFNSALQNTQLIHFGDEGIYEIQMELTTLTYEAKLHLPSMKNSENIVGIQGFNQINTNLNDRETILLPNATTTNFSAFVLLQRTFFKMLKIQSGIRYDTKSIITQKVGIETDTMLYRPPLDKTFGSFSGSLGATYNYSETLLFRANFAAAYRTPNLAELTSNGPHELRFEIGDPNLVAENSYETDLNIHYHADNITFDVAGFYNVIKNYIYISPTSDTTNAGIDIFKYKQTHSLLFGGETDFHFHPKNLEWMHFETTFSSVIGKQENGDYLPFVPAHKVRFELRAEKENFWQLKNIFVTVNSCTAFNQNNPAPDETATAGYTLIDLSLGGEIVIKKQFVSISISATNLFDTKYMDHLSTLKEVQLYNPGRNLSLNLKIPFGITINENY